MHYPLRSEADAFRLVVIIVVGAAAVTALALLIRPAVGGILAAALLGLGLGFAWRGARGSEPRLTEVATSPADGCHRILVVANQTVGGKALLGEIRNRARGRESEILVVTPALTKSQIQHWTSDVDEALMEADRRREQSVQAIESAGLRASSEVGDSDPNLAIESALLRFPADELIISTHPPDRSRWLERGVVDRARRDIDLPITHVIVDLEAEKEQVPSAA
jgi:GABA permease